MERSDAIELEGMNFGAVLKKKEKLPTMLLMFLQVRAAPRAAGHLRPRRCRAARRADAAARRAAVRPEGRGREGGSRPRLPAVHGQVGLRWPAPLAQDEVRPETARWPRHPQGARGAEDRRGARHSNKEPGQYLEDVGTDPSLYEAAEVKQVQHTEGAGVADLCTGRVCIIGLLDKMDPFHKDQLGVLEAVALRLAATTEEEVPVVWVDAAQQGAYIESFGVSGAPLSIHFRLCLSVSLPLPLCLCLCLCALCLCALVPLPLPSSTRKGVSVALAEAARRARPRSSGRRAAMRAERRGLGRTSDRRGLRAGLGRLRPGEHRPSAITPVSRRSDAVLIGRTAASSSGPTTWTR